MNYLERSKKQWKVAGTFPPNKEDVYPEHKEVQEFDLIRGLRVYEYGCGGGSDVLSYLRRGNHVTATDIVPENIETTKARIRMERPPVSEDKFNIVLLEDSYPLPFENNSFDVISSHGVLHHIIDPNPVIKELYRVCKSQGYLYVMLYTNIMEDYFNELGLINKFMRENNINYNEAFGWCTDGPGTPYSRSYSVEQGAEFIEDVGGFVLVDYNYWLNDHFITYKAQKI